MDLIDRFGPVKKTLSPPSNLGILPFDGNLLGGLLIGVGMAVTGACPGTSFVQAGVGNINGVFVILGGLLGAFTFVKLQDRLREMRKEADASLAANSPDSDVAGSASKTPADIATALGISPLVLLLIWVPMCLTAMRLVFATDHSSQALENPGLIAPAYGGLLIGLAQMATILLTKHAIGASGGYEDVARWLDAKYLSKSGPEDPERVLLTGSVIFSIGILCASFCLRQLFPSYGHSLVQGLLASSPTIAAKAILGGFAMVIGARLARGCTSGHGISGLSKFSLPSLVTTASMFGAGIVTAAVI